MDDEPALLNNFTIVYYSYFSESIFILLLLIIYTIYTYYYKIKLFDQSINKWYTIYI